ncbi:hypothetical protein [Hydrogenophaga sp. 5NK40-0174]|uniref:hypothetical protein n=1 Tax=Hydrogenophaga sp. 5NK40-0174 TaxID=3127649 RepID=UPI0033406F19
MQVILGQAPTARPTGASIARARLRLGHGAPTLALAAMVCLAIGAIYWSHGDTRPVAAVPAAEPAQKAPHPWWNDADLGVGHDAGQTVEEGPRAAPAEQAGQAAARVPALPDGGGERLFRLDEDGRIKTDVRMRNGIERMVALTEPAELPQKLEEAVQGLPAEQAAAARELVGRFQAYQDAQRRTYAPGTEHLVPEEALAELDGLRAMRSSYFGEATAAQMFGEEEKVSRRLLELMRDDPVPDAPLWEKAVRAQARFDQEQAGGPEAATESDDEASTAQATRSPMGR